MPRVAFAYDVDYENGVGDGLDLYVNMWGSSSSIRSRPPPKEAFCFNSSNFWIPSFISMADS